MSKPQETTIADRLRKALASGKLVSSHNSGKAKCEREWNWRVASMKDYDLWYVAAGTGEIEINSKKYPIEAGSCFFIRPGDQIYAEQHPDDRLTVLYIHFCMEPDPISPDPFACWPSLVKIQDSHWFETLLNRLLTLDDETNEGRLQHADNVSGGEEAEFEAVLRTTLCVLAREAFELSHKQHTPMTIRRMIRFIRESATSPPSHAELARMAGWSERYLNTQFKRYTGMSIKTFIAKSRIERACRLLEESTLSIGQIADALGYGDIYFFSKQFKKFTGVPPSRYRHDTVGSLSYGGKHLR